MNPTMLPNSLRDKARELQRRAAAASNPQVRQALLKSAREFEQKAKAASGDAVIE